MKISELKEKRRRRKRIERLTAAVIVLGAGIVVTACVLLIRTQLLPFLFSSHRTQVSSTAQNGPVSGAEAVLTETPPDETANDADGTGEAGIGEPGQVSTPTPSPTPTPPSTGWHSDATGRFYILDDGTRATGFFTDGDGSTYYFSKEGYPHTGWLELKSGHYWFDNNGIMVTGLKKIGDDLYYFGYDGVMLTGWQEGDGDDRYYFGEDGKAYTGKHTIDGKICYFDENGVLDPSRTEDAPVAADKMVCLTFDDGPGIYTGQILDLLERYHAKATFFMIGEQVEDFASSVKREHEMGMEQGNHSWDHKTLTHLSTEDLDKEILKTQDVIEEVTGERPRLFRPPGGGYNETVQEHSDGMPLIMWDVDTLDWKTKDAGKTYDVVMNEVQDGSIILMHEIYQASYEAAERIIPDLIKKGYAFVTISEMAEAKGIGLEPGEVYAEFWE